MRGRAGPATEISVFATEISVTGMKIFPYEHSSPVTGTNNFRQNSFAFTRQRPKWYNFGLVRISISGECEIAVGLNPIWDSEFFRVPSPYIQYHVVVVLSLIYLKFGIFYSLKAVVN